MFDVSFKRNVVCICMLLFVCLFVCLSVCLSVYVGLLLDVTLYTCN